MKVDLLPNEIHTLTHLLDHAIGLSQTHGTNDGTMKLIMLRDKLKNAAPETVSQTVRQRDAQRRAASFGFNGGE